MKKTWIELLSFYELMNREKISARAQSKISPVAILWIFTVNFALDLVHNQVWQTNTFALASGWACVPRAVIAQYNIALFSLALYICVCVCYMFFHFDFCL